MMRRLKWWHWLLIGLVTVAMVGGVLVLLAFAPGVQRRAFLAAVEAPGREVHVDRLSAGFGGVEIDGLSWAEGGRHVTVRELRLKMPVLDAVLHDRVAIDELSIRGLTADLGRTASAPPDSQPEAAETHAPASTQETIAPIPIDLSVRRIAIDGEVVLPGTGADRPRASFALEGGGFARGQEARFSLRGRVLDPGVQALQGGVELSGEMTVRQSAQAEIEALNLSLQSPWLTGTLSSSLPQGKGGARAVEGSFRGDIERVMALVPAAVRPPLDAGTFEAKLRAAEGEGAMHTLTLQLDARELAGSTAEGPVALHGLGIELSATGPTDGPVAVQTTVTITDARAEDASDLRVQGNVNTPSATPRLDLAVTSRRLSLPAVQKLAALLTPPTESEGPPWAGVEGDIALTLQRVELSPDAAAENIDGSIHIAASGVTIQGVTGVFMDAPFQGDTTLSYAADTRRFGLTGVFGFTDLDVGKALKAAQPDRPPDLEGVFTVRAAVEASAADLPGLATAMRGDLKLQGKQGVFRGLRQKTGGALTSAAGLVGALTRSRTAATVAEIGAMLEAVPYEEIVIDATLGEGDVLQVRSLALRAPELALSGSGTLTLARGGSWVDWLKAPMALEMDLGGKGRLGQWLTQFGVAAPQADPAGYMPLKKPFKLGGSLSATDSSDLWSTLGRAVANAATQLLPPAAPKAAPDSPGTSTDKAP